MTNETKYNIGQNVWFKNSDHVAFMEVKEIIISNYKGSNRVCIEYRLTNGYREKTKQQSELYSTKEELLKSL